MSSRYKQTQSELIRKQGFVQGLRAAHTILRKAKNYQARMGERASEKSDPDVKAVYEHAASTLHDLCLKLQDAIKKAGEK
jgi:hypothetical protein